MTSIGSRVTAWAGIAAPLLLLASTIAYLANGEGLSSGELAGALQMWAFVAFGVAIVGLARLLESGRPRSAAALSVLGVIGVAGGAAYGIDSIQASFLRSTIDLGESAVAPLALRIPGLAFPLAMIGLGALLSMRGDAPRFAGISVALGAVLFPPARIGDIEGLAILSDVLLTIGMVTVGVGLLAGRSTPPRSSAALSAADELRA